MERKLLQAARGYLAYPRDWCQGAAAVDRDGREVSPWHPVAARWSVEGAIARAGACGTWPVGTEAQALRRVVAVLVESHPGKRLDGDIDRVVLEKWNDGIYGDVDHAAVQAVLAAAMGGPA